MRRNYFVKLINYMKNVYHIENGIRKLKDGRVNPKYKTQQVITPLLLGFLLRIESMNEFKFRLQKDEFINVFSRGTKLPKIDTIRDTLKVLNTDGLKAILHHTVKRAIANILQLFLCRRLRRNYETQKEIVRLIVNGFIKMEYLPELVFKGS